MGSLSYFSSMLEIRKAKSSDAAQLAPIMLLAMEEIVYYFLGETNKEKAIAFLEEHISKTSNQYSYENIIVAEENGVILGQLCLYPGSELEQLRTPILAHLEREYNNLLELEKETQEGEIYLDTLAVSPTAQGKGIGKMLLLYAIDYYVTVRKQTLGLLVDKDNPDAKKLYLKIGFKPVRELFIFEKEMEHLQYAPVEA